MTDAIHLALGDLAVGLIVAVVLSCLLWLIASAQKDGPQRVRLPREEPVDLEEEIRSYRQRKDAEFFAGPEGRERLPSGRRVA